MRKCYGLVALFLVLVLFTSSCGNAATTHYSQQAILLRKAAQAQLGDAHALDHNLVAISSPDGEQAFLSGQLAAHYAGAPFQEREVAAGGHIILHSTDAFGPVGAALVTLRQSFYDQYPDFAKKLYQDINAATVFIHTYHAQAAQYLSQDQGGGGTPAQFKTLLDEQAIVFDTTPSGLVSYAIFMQSIGLISKTPGSVRLCHRKLMRRPIYQVRSTFHVIKLMPWLPHCFRISWQRLLSTVQMDPARVQLLLLRNWNSLGTQTSKTTKQASKIGSRQVCLPKAGYI